MSTISQTDFKNLKLFRRGKVRDVYDLDSCLLIVATDRVSAFDVIMPNPIPQKGEILNNISSFWFQKTKHIIDNHLMSTNVKDFPEVCWPYSDTLKRRSMLVKKTQAIPIECIVRGYISGSGWNEYMKTGAISGCSLPKNLQESQKLTEPIFTPTTKAEVGHDQSISFDKVGDKIGSDLAKKIRDVSIRIYQFAAGYALKKGIIIADTKMEFGLYENELMLIDELLTPDSSRFWPLAQYKSGGKPLSFDKQFLRDYLLVIDWDHNTPAPSLPEEVIRKTGEKYAEAFRLLTQ